MLGKAFACLVLCVGLVHLSYQSITGDESPEQCAMKPPESIQKMEVSNMNNSCVEVVKKHIAKELNASITYIVMGSHFLDAANFRPGLAKMLLKHAGEERQHARALMDYLLMRGETITKDEIPTLAPLSTNYGSMYDALHTTLKIEEEVRNDFVKIIMQCEGGDDAEHAHVDYHISDFLTGTFLEEQHQGVHELSLLLANLGRMLNGNGNNAFVEYEFDRTMLQSP